MQIIPPRMLPCFFYLFSVSVIFVCGTGTSSLRRSGIIATEKHIISNYTNQAGMKIYLYTKNIFEQK